MAHLDRNYVLSLLNESFGAENGRLRFYRTQPYPAMTAIAADRAFTLSLLIEAIASGLLEELEAKGDQLRAEEVAESALAAEREADAHYAATLAAAELDAASRFPAASPLSDTPLAVAFGTAPAVPKPFALGHVVNIADTNHANYGTRVVVTGDEPVSGDIVVEYGDGSVHAFAPAQLMHHVAFAAHLREDESDAEWAAEGRATAMSASELYEADRDDEFRLDADDEERNLAEAEANDHHDAADDEPYEADEDGDED